MIKETVYIKINAAKKVLFAARPQTWEHNRQAMATAVH